MRTRRLLGGLLAAIALAALLIGVPLLLVYGLGNPLPDWDALKSGVISDQVVLQLLGCVLWIAWAQWVPGSLMEIAAGAADVRTKRGMHPRLPARAPRHISAGQGLSRALVTAIIGVAIATPVVADAARAWAVPASPPAGESATVVMPGSAGQRASDDAGSSDSDGRSPAISTRVVRPVLAQATAKEHPVFVVGSDPTAGPSLWSIAEHTMGDPLRWRDIWALNRDHRMSDGTTFTNPDLIQNGWRLELPADATVPHPVGGGVEVTVRRGDTIDAIARDQLHVDPDRLIEANLGRNEPGGRIFDDPNLILPGWKLWIPTATGTGPSHTRPGSPNHRPTTPDHPGHRGHRGNTAPTSPTSPTTPIAPTSSTAPTTEPPIPAAPAQSAESKQHAQSGNVATNRSASDLPMLAFAGGGVLLAGASFTALLVYRRRQFRLRRPGHAISASPPALLRAERTLLSLGGPAALDVTWLDQVLRGLVHAVADGSDPASLAARLPDVIAVRLACDELELVLANAQPSAPKPWRVDETGLRWSICRGEDCGYDPYRRAYHFAPFPTLTSVGYAEDGSQWLLDLERVGSLSLAGDANRCLDLARFLVCELAHNTWSEMLRVTLVGFGQELVAANPDRLTYTAEVDDAIAEIHEQVDAVNTAEKGDGLNLATARIGVSAGDTWAPHVLLVGQDAVSDQDQLDRLLAALRASRSRSAAAVVFIDTAERADATWTLTVDGDGALHIPDLGLQLTAQQMPADDAAEIAQLLALAAMTGDVPMPASPGRHPWDQYADAAGALQVREADPSAGARLTSDEADPSIDDANSSTDPKTTGGTQTADAPALHLADSSPQTHPSVLPLPQSAYLDRAATTAEDLAALAPETSDAIRATVESAVGQLDADLAEWYDESTTRPKVSLLGPVRVGAQGPLPQRNPRVEWHTEIVAYLVTRPSGVSSEEYGTALWPNDPDVDGKSKVRQSAMIVRKWLGKNPETGIEYLPPAMAPGHASYRVEGALVDAELFRRLRLRGLARGADGIDDLWAALRLVTGEPFSDRRKEGYAWLADVPLHHVYSAMVVDVAHTVATHHLGAREPERAAEAAQVALDAGSTEDVPLLDKVAACDAQDLRAEADAFVKRILANHDAEIEEDLPPRTAAVLMRRQWIGNAS